jgi:hypothetical protein
VHDSLYNSNYSFLLYYVIDYNDVNENDMWLILVE